MTHDELVDRAIRWLKTTRGCGVVFREHTACFEHPDALGFRTATSIMVECKISRADFYADKQKASRVLMQHALADRPANECWYLVPPGLLTPVDIPAGWGLLEANARRITVIKKVEDDLPPRSAYSLQHEVYRLYCEVRRYQLHGLTYPPLTQKKESP